MPYCDSKKAIFLHIPKTGGTTVMRLLDIRLFFDSNPGVRPSPQHFSCNILRERIGAEKYDNYYKFVFVRNPWARILSSYYWRQQLPKKRPAILFDDFVKKAQHIVQNKLYYEQEFGEHFIPQIEYTKDVDDIFRYENFKSSLMTVASKLKTPIPLIPDKTPKHYDDYWNFYSDSSREIITDIYQDEIVKFGYEFG